MDAKGKFFHPVQIRTISKFVEHSIKEQIVKGVLKPGYKLPTQTELSKQFNVSIVTIREALKGLETLGLIKKRKGRGGGIYVSELNSDSLKAALADFLNMRDVSAKHLVEVRLTIEPYAIKKAATEITPAELEGLRQNIRNCEEKLKLAENRDLTREEYFELESENIEFIRLIANATHNPVLALTIDCVMEFLHHFEKTILSSNIEYSRSVIASHKTLLAMIEKGDLDNIEEAMISHIKKVEDEIWKQEDFGWIG